LFRKRNLSEGNEKHNNGMKSDQEGSAVFACAQVRIAFLAAYAERYVYKKWRFLNLK